MNIISDFNKDISAAIGKPGGYEWWYFDAVSFDDKYSLVIIFYRGNPFSNHYIKQLEKECSSLSKPSYFPAVSISVYEDGDPIYYSFTEYDAADSMFSSHFLSVTVGPHKLEGNVTENELIYELQIDEKLPSGDRIDAGITFKSPVISQPLFAHQKNSSVNHIWNLIQPRAEVQGRIEIADDEANIQQIEFAGSGYHDHNMGKEPMRSEFSDWYWGRIHFEYATLVFYVMNKKASQQHHAWLMSNDNAQIMCDFNDITLSDHTYSIFGLSSARKLLLQSEQAKIHIQQTALIDNGPFYQRFKNDGFLQIASGDIVEAQSGISEYIHPDRIYSRMFWPLVNMRIRYAADKPHWVQRSKKLYRWTW